MRSRSSSMTGTSVQCRFGATSSAPRWMSTRPGSATVAPIGRRPCARTSFSAPCVERAERVEDLLDAAAAVVDGLHRLVAGAAGQIGGLDAEVVDVDLQPERDHAVARDVDDQARPPGGAAVLRAALDEQAELHQLADQAGHRALVQAGVLGDGRARPRAAFHHLPQHDAQVVAPDRPLTRELDCRLGGPHEWTEPIDAGRRGVPGGTPRRGMTHGVVVDSVNVSVLL